MEKQKYTGEIFELLSKGLFICSNSTNDNIRRLYNYTDQNFDDLKEYFGEINFTLERGDEYFYFSRQETKVDLTRKLETAFKWIDIVDFFKTFDNSFGASYRFTPSDILVRLNVDAVLKTKLSSLQKYTKEEKLADSIQKLLKNLCNDGYAELENEISNSYKIMASFSYLEEFILNINIPEEIQNEIPE